MSALFTAIPKFPTKQTNKQNILRKRKKKTKNSLTCDCNLHTAVNERLTATKIMK